MSVEEIAQEGISVHVGLVAVISLLRGGLHLYVEQVHSFLVRNGGSETASGNLLATLSLLGVIEIQQKLVRRGPSFDTACSEIERAIGGNPWTHEAYTVAAEAMLKPRRFPVTSGPADSSLN